MSIKERRKALGLVRKELASKAYVDPRILQLIEMGQHSDAEATDRLDATLTLLENDKPLPDWKTIVDQQIADQPDVAKL